MTTAAGDHWRAQLEGWAIPQEILDHTDESPWQLPSRCFSPEANPATPTTTTRCLEALDDTDKARTQYRELIEKHPQSPFADKARARLEALER